MKINDVRVGELRDAATPLEFRGNADDALNEVLPLDDALRTDASHALTWVNDKNIHKLDKHKGKIGLLICGEGIRQVELHPGTNALVVDNPRLTFLNLLSRSYQRFTEKGVSSTAQIAKTARIGSDNFIGHNVVIEDNVVIGNNCYIGHNTVIRRDTLISSNVIVGASCTIGGEGFGYERNETGQYTFMPHVGKVVIHDDVEIGNNTCVDRGVLGDTVIGRNAKIDNFVHVAHNVQVGENCLLIAHAMIGGSVKLGKNVWVGPSAAIMNGLTIGDNAVIGLAAVVVKNLDENVTVAGNPAMPTDELRLWSSVRKKIINEYK